MSGIETAIAKKGTGVKFFSYIFFSVVHKYKAVDDSNYNYYLMRSLNMHVCPFSILVEQVIS